MMRVLPNMTVLAPGDPIETRLLTKAAIERPGPCYLRLGKAGEPIVHTSQPEVTIGKAIVLREGDAGTLISTGGALAMVVKAADELSARGVSVSVLSMPSLSPLDKEAILRAAQTTGRIVTVENHGMTVAALAALSPKCSLRPHSTLASPPSISRARPIQGRWL